MRSDRRLRADCRPSVDYRPSADCRRCADHGLRAGRRRGIALLEAVIGLAIVAMTTVAALGAAAAQLRATERSRRALEAAALATERLGVLDFLTDYELLALPDSVEQGRFGPPLDGYSWRTTAGAREGEEGVYDVAVWIAWDGGDYTVHSALYRRPLVVSQ